MTVSNLNKTTFVCNVLFCLSIALSQPVFAKSTEHGVFGPGHNCFTKSPDGKEDWIVYHAKTEANKECKNRTPRAQRFTWKPDGNPDFGMPVAAGTAVRKPSSTGK